MEALQGAARRFGIECAGGYVIGTEIIKQGARHGGLADPALIRAYHDHYRLRHELPLCPSNPDHWRTHAIGKSPSLLWARTWQKQGRIQFIRRPVRVNPADVVNAARAVRTRVCRVKCPMLL